VIGSRELLTALLEVAGRGYASGTLLDLAVRAQDPELSVSKRAATVERIRINLLHRLRTEPECLGVLGHLSVNGKTRPVTILNGVLNPQSERFLDADIDGLAHPGFAVDMGGPHLFRADGELPEALAFPGAERLWRPAVLYAPAHAALPAVTPALLDLVADLLPLMSYNAARDLDYDEW
jgi:hypothetical protein